MCLGGHGVVSVISNVLPREMKNIVWQCFTKNFDAAKSSHYKLYDLMNDPLEEKNISSEQPEIAKNMEKSLSELRNFDVKELDFDDAEKERVENTLKKLGYI